MQPHAALDRNVRTAQLLIQLTRRARLPLARGIQRLAIAVFDRIGYDRHGAAHGQPRDNDDKHKAQADKQVAARLRHAGFRNRRS
ncbi:hypothetical protein D3C81_1291590 [compost metagenome]